MVKAPGFRPRCRGRPGLTDCIPTSHAGNIKDNFSPGGRCALRLRPAAALTHGFNQGRGRRTLRDKRAAEGWRAIYGGSSPPRTRRTQRFTEQTGGVVALSPPTGR